jgi:predicted RNA binding protein YcfA (HicA-like mRNA interferase family)
LVRLANISGEKAVKAFMRLGYKIARQTGSHIILIHEDRPTLTIPNHRELAPGLLRSVIRQAGLGIDKFINAL